ncbi:MAG: M64 family metallopeptidase [Rhodopila sp.]
MPDSVTQILASGPVGTKINIAVLGDGFAVADQTLYNNKVQEFLIDGVFGHDYFYEDKQAFNIFRVNLISVDSGVSTRVYNEARRTTQATIRSPAQRCAIPRWAISSADHGRIAGWRAAPIPQHWWRTPFQNGCLTTIWS